MFERFRPLSLVSKTVFPLKHDHDFNSSLSIAGLTIGIYSALDLPLLSSERFLPFQTSSTKKDIEVHFHSIGGESLTGPPIDPESDPRLSNAGRRGTDSPLLRSRQVQTRLNASRSHTDRLFVEILREAISILDFKSSRADFFIMPGSKPGFKDRLIGPAMLAPFLPRFNACLLHASAVVRRGKTAVFLAPDEGGKTTAACLAPGGTILGDDQVPLRRHGNGFRAFGTPWGLHVDPKRQAPLAGLFLLDKASRFALARLTPRELVPHIWREVQDPLSILPRPLKKKAFTPVCAIAAAAPAWKLSFPRDHIDWEILDRALDQKTSAPAKRNKQGQKNHG
jgi:hypothetical protein